MLSLLLTIGIMLGAVDTAQTIRYTGHGYEEANPLWRGASPAVIVTVKTGIDIGMAVGLHKVGRKHRKAAIVGALAIIVIRGVVVARNYHVTGGK